MKTVKEIGEIMEKYGHSEEYKIAFQNGYKTAIEGIFNDIVNSQTTSVEEIEKFLQDLMK